MTRPTSATPVSGRRRLRPDSVPATTLLTDSAATATSHRRRGSKIANAGKIGALTTGTVVLCAALITASDIGSNRLILGDSAPPAAPTKIVDRADTAQAPKESAEPTGRSVAPKSSVQTLAGAPPNNGGKHDTSTDPTHPEPDNTGTNPGRDADSTSATAAPRSAATTTPRADDQYQLQSAHDDHTAAQLQTVRAMYTNAPARGGLLDGVLPDLIGGLLGRAPSVQIESLSPQSNSQVLSTVLTRRADGSMVRVRQLITLTDSANPVVTAVRLLSTQVA